jgi:hypothetical protein
MTATPAAVPDRSSEPGTAPDVRGGEGVCVIFGWLGVALGLNGRLRAQAKATGMAEL